MAARTWAGLVPELRDERSVSSAFALAVKRGEVEKDEALPLATSCDARSHDCWEVSGWPGGACAAKVVLSCETCWTSDGMTEARNSYSVV